MITKIKEYLATIIDSEGNDFEKQFLKILLKETEWYDLDSKQKQEKRKHLLIYFAERGIESFELEKNVVELYDIGLGLMEKIKYKHDKVFQRLLVFVLIEQEFIDEFPFTNISKIRTVDVTLFDNLLKEIRERVPETYDELNLDNYLRILNSIWKRGNVPN
jgi:hypothetical protein